MGLSNFFKINMPYGIEKKDTGWYVFNREYLPLGKNSFFFDKNHFYQPEQTDLTEYIKLTDKSIEKIIINKKLIQYDHKKISKVFFYDNKTNPSITKKKQDWDDYFKILEKFSIFKVRPKKIIRGNLK